MMGIYSIGKAEDLYVGKSQNIEVRWNEHRKLLSRNTHHNHKLQELYNSCSSLEYRVLEVANSVSDLSRLENTWIEKLGTLNISGTSSGFPRLVKPLEESLLLLATEYINDKQARIPALCAKYSIPEKPVFNIKSGYSYFYLREEFEVIKRFIEEPTRYNSNKTSEKINNVSEALLEMSKFTREVSDIEKTFGVHNLRSVVRGKRFLECEIPDILLEGIDKMGKYYNVCSSDNLAVVKSIIEEVNYKNSSFTETAKLVGVSRPTVSKIYRRELPKWQWLYSLMPELWE